MSERVVRFGHQSGLVGVLALPPEGKDSGTSAGVLLINAGMLHRVGPNRIYVGLARSLARLGYPALRFDLAGLGDSASHDDNRPFGESAIQDVRAAMEYLAAEHRVTQFVLFGHCSGADFAFQTMQKDSRVSGAILVNGALLPRGVYAQLAKRITAMTRQRQWRKQMATLDSWRRLLAPGRGVQAIKRGVATQLRGLFRRRSPEMSFDYLLPPWVDLGPRAGAILLIYSEWSGQFDTFRLTLEKHLQTLPEGVRPTLSVLPDTDHTFTPVWSQEQVIQSVCGWVARCDRVYTVASKAGG